MSAPTATAQPRRGRSAVLALGLVAGFVTILTACPPPPTPTTTTTTTTSTTTTTIAPGCVGYTPTGIGVSDNIVSAGDSITVSGFGIANSQIEVKLVPLGSGTATGVLATATVAPNGSWVTAVTIPTLTLGNWKVVANAVGCTGTGSATVQVV